MNGKNERENEEIEVKKGFFIQKKCFRTLKPAR